MSAQGGARAWAGDGSLPELVSVVVVLYVINLALHALVFSSRNPHIRPRAQNVLLTACRLLFGAPVNVLLGAWLAFWILLWELVRAPLWKPRAVRRVPDDLSLIHI